MNKITNRLRRLRYKPNKEYYISIRKIRVKYSFRRTRIGDDKWRSKCRYFNQKGKLESQIVLNYDYLLLDGYTSFRIAENYNLGVVPVIFKEEL